MLSIVIPIDLSRRPSNLLERVKDMVHAVKSTSFQIVIGHNDRAKAHDVKLKQMLKDQPGVTLVSKFIAFEETNHSALRNIAVAAAEFETILFLDADIYADIDLFRYLACRVAAGEPYAMSPCLYLTPTGTRQLVNKKNGAEIVEEFLKFDRRKVLHLAMPSSIIAMRKEDYFSLGGFNEAYRGHGYEDFDFMMRLAVRSKKVRISSQISIDRTYRAPLLAEGFRAALAEACIPLILEKKFAFHLWHSKDSNESYYRRRSETPRYFRAK